MVEELDGQFTTPDRLSVRHIERLASELRGGFADLICHILQENRGQNFDTQWAALLQTLTEAARGEEEIPATPTTSDRPPPDAVAAARSGDPPRDDPGRLHPALHRARGAAEGADG